MKPDGATMETSEPDQAAAAHRPPQEAATEEGQPAAAAAQKANGKPVAVDPKARLKAGGSKVQPSSTGVAGSGSRPGTASHRAEKDAKPSAGRKAAGSASAAGAAPNRAAGAKNQSRVLDRRPVGPVKTSSLPDAAASNGTKPRGPNGAAKRAPAQAANGAKPKTTAPKSNNSNSTKPAAPAASKTTTTSTRPAAGSLTSRPASTVPKPAAAAKPSITATAKVSRAAAPPPAGRTAAVQPNKNAPAAKKDVSRPLPAARKPVAAAEPPAARKPAAAAEPPAARKPVAAAAAGLPASKKIEASRSANAAKPNSAPKAATATKAAAPKVQPPAKPAPTKKPPAAARLPLASRAPGRTPPASPAGRPAGASKPATPATKRGARPPQTGSPFTKKTSNPPVPEAPPQRTAAPAADPAAPTEKPESAAVEEVQTRGDGEPEEVAQREEAAPPHPLTPPPQQEQTTVAPSGAPPKEPGSPDQTPAPPAASFAPKAAPLNLNEEEEEEEEEEEREGSQLVSVSEMSGTTQPTEESRPGSGGAVGGAAWKAGGVWLSELDSEEVSGSQQGASELSAPGVLEGTESTDELGDGSLKGAMDMEGASAGSPDFEKVPDIPANEDDDSDRVCDMEVGSERTDEPRGPRHDNDVDEEDDEDVEMASEGVTESGLESYGNADEDDFADDERLDNLNRVVQPPPPPLPSAPAAQWDQQNPSDCRWAGPSQSCLPQGPGGEPEAQAWPGGGASASAPEGQEVPHPPQTADPRGPAAAPGPSPSSEASTPEERHQERKLSSPAFEAPPQSSQEVQTEREEEEEEEEAEPETLPADEVLGGPSTAPTSNPSSSSVTEDEASDTEGEAQLEASSAICNLTFDPIPPPQRCLSTVEEEAERAPGDEAASPPSFIFDSNTTPSTKSPGIFSLEELPLEAIKEPYMEAGRQEAEPAKEAGPERRGSKEPLEETTDVQPQYYAICEKTDDSFPGSSSMPQRRDHSSYPRTFCDIIKPAAAPPRLSCADLPPRSAGQQALSPQLRRLEQHHRQLQELQQRREQQSRPLEEAEQERKRRAEEEERKKKEEAEEEIKRNKEEEELKQMMQWQQEARQEAQQEAQPSSKAQAALPSPSSVLCTIYEALESSEEEAEDGEPLEKESPGPEPPPLPDSPERPPPLDLDWGEKVDMVQQLINQTLLLHGDGCSSLLLLPGGSGGTLSPLESSLWPRLLPPLSPPSATVTSVSSFSPEAAGSSSQGEWTVVELETHH
ncbi:PREDICTED: nascent polypeptide-associated complex subunit alpha, muscle-specific form-like isoform X2 [Cyprinodon variegatus]|uniref:nascent polypeptide-associated complex subunit alpha, muscle-specific form-like isoform X2 n=1 Tax=Cyprinodon variegatus TaxID=28743 RepID=UPI000742A528|nr:PREDICTED: nascent polypeptide-associated complex subunit alpha, muscle-specific form-like isoform X2 [Cyprinodon variegatus]